MRNKNVLSMKLDNGKKIYLALKECQTNGITDSLVLSLCDKNGKTENKDFIFNISTTFKFTRYKLSNKETGLCLNKKNQIKIKNKNITYAHYSKETKDPVHIIKKIDKKDLYLKLIQGNKTHIDVVTYDIIDKGIEYYLFRLCSDGTLHRFSGISENLGFDLTKKRKIKKDKNNINNNN